MFSDQFRRGESDKSKLTGVRGSKLLSNLSDVAWKAFQSVNTLLPEGEAPGHNTGREQNTCDADQGQGG